MVDSGDSQYQLTSDQRFDNEDTEEDQKKMFPFALPPNYGILSNCVFEEQKRLPGLPMLPTLPNLI